MLALLMWISQIIDQNQTLNNFLVKLITTRLKQTIPTLTH